LAFINTSPPGAFNDMATNNSEECAG